MERSRGLLVAVGVLVVAFVVASAVLGTPPGAADSGAQVVAWMRDHGGNVRAAAFGMVVAAVALLAAIGIMRERLPAPHRSVFFAGGIVVVVATMVQQWTFLGLALHPDTLRPDVARTVLDVGIFYGPLLTAATIAMAGAVGLLAFRGQLPTWLGVLSAVFVAEQAIETITIRGTDGFTEPGGAMNMQLGAGLFVVWFVATAIVLARSPAAESS